MNKLTEEEQKVKEVEFELEEGIKYFCNPNKSENIFCVFCLKEKGKRHDFSFNHGI